ncbi:hypothetical protein [Micromonospora sp. NBC_00617]|uniref:hypothetical protein n=1 Tax=Micromonospora sp. NBC_00617 TaxID=2903587 RepID=UPI0038676285
MPLPGERRVDSAEVGEADLAGPSSRGGGRHLRQHTEVQDAEFHLAGFPPQVDRLTGTGDEKGVAGAEPVGRTLVGAADHRGTGAADDQPVHVAHLDVEMSGLPGRGEGERPGVDALVDEVVSGLAGADPQVRGVRAGQESVDGHRVAAVELSGLHW